MHFLSLFSCSKCGFTAGGKKKVPTSFPKIDKIYIYMFWHLFHFLIFIACLDIIFFSFFNLLFMCLLVFVFLV